MAYYQLVGYNWNHYWANREVSRVTNSEINHVSIRVVPFCGDNDSNELYVSHRKTDTWVPTSVVERLHSPAVWTGRLVPLPSFHLIQKIKSRANWWKNEQPGNLWHPYFHHYIGRRLGMEAPWSCTRLCKLALKDLGVEVNEDFYPNLLIQDYIKETY